MFLPKCKSSRSSEEATQRVSELSPRDVTDIVWARHTVNASPGCCATNAWPTLRIRVEGHSQTV